MRFLASLGLVLALSAPAMAGEGTPLSLYDRLAAKLAADPKLAAAIGKPAPEMQSIAWMIGDWDVTTRVFATARQKESISTEHSHIAPALGGVWLAQTDSYGSAAQDQTWTTFNPMTRRWISVSVDVTGNAVRTEARGWTGNTLVFRGDVEIVGERVTLRQTLTKTGSREFSFRNEERLSSGTWVPLDEYVLRKASRSLRPQTRDSRRP